MLEGKRRPIKAVFKKWYLWVLFVLLSIVNTPWYALEVTPSKVVGSLIGSFVIALIIALIIFAARKFR